MRHGFALLFLLLIFAAAPLAAQKKAANLAPENLALGKKATASSFQDQERSPDKGIDGDPTTRWSPSGGGAKQWYQVDLGQPQDLAGCRICWEFSGPSKVQPTGASGPSWSIKPAPPCRSRFTSTRSRRPASAMSSCRRQHCHAGSGQVSLSLKSSVPGWSRSRRPRLPRAAVLPT
jgi:hypothetical protein